MIEAVTFDFWNTLMFEAPAGTLRQHRLAYWREHMPEADTEALAVAHDAAHQEHLNSWVNGEQYVIEDATARMRKLLRAPGASEVVLLGGFIEGSREANVLACAGAEDCMRELKAAGLAIGIVCDVGLTPSSVLTEMLGAVDLLRYVDVPLFSDQLGIYKPDARIFEAALNRLGVASHAAVHIGDRRRTDVAGAHAAGLKAVRYRAVYDDDNNVQLPEADVVIDRLVDLPSVLAGFS
jgi:FMN phosphatase YigB (HAD superfamily)